MAAPMLWKLVDVGSDAVTSDGDFVAALRQHLHYTPNGLVAVLLQIKEEQSAYVIQTGCAGCVVDRCVPGCRVALLRRVLGVGYPDGQLVAVKNGLSERPYTRTVVAWPCDDAEVLDRSLVAGWTDARLQVHWRSTQWYQPQHWRRAGQGNAQLAASALLQVGDDGDDPLERLRDRGWNGYRLHRALPWLRGQRCSPPFWVRRSTTLAPHLLSPVAAARPRSDRPRTRTVANGTPDIAHVTSYSNAATIAHHLAEAGARIELLDLESDGWTAQAMATAANGDDVRPIFETLQSPGSPLAVCDGAGGTVVLDPAQTRSSEDVPPLLYLGTRPDGRRRWRPLSATHHLVIAGAIAEGVIAGMLAPAILRHSGLRIGVLDLAADGALNLQLQHLPQRLPATDGRSCAELLGVIGGLDDSKQPVVVVLRTDRVEDAQPALVSLLRAAMYRPISVVLIVPRIDAIPPLIQERCPLVVVHEHVARVHAPEGTWQWANPTLLRLPWRASEEAWSRSKEDQPRALLPREGFWVVPRELQHLLTTPQHVVKDGESAAGSDEAIPQTTSDLEQENAAPSSTRNGEHGSSASLTVPDAVQQRGASEAVVVMPQRPSRRCRVYDRVVRAQHEPQAHATPTLQPVDDAVPPAQMTDTHAVKPLSVTREHGLPVGALSSDVPTPGRSPSSEYDAAALAAYKPREDAAGNLVVDDLLLVFTLQWAEQVGHEAQGVPITRFKRALDLPTKAHSRQLRDALRERGLIRREVRDGWYRLVTVRDAVSSGKLPPGPWYLLSSPNDHADVPTTPEPFAERASEHCFESDVPGNGANVAPVNASHDQSTPVSSADAVEELT